MSQKSPPAVKLKPKTDASLLPTQPVQKGENTSMSVVDSFTGATQKLESYVESRAEPHTQRKRRKSSDFRDITAAQPDRSASPTSRKRLRSVLPLDSQTKT